MRTIRPILCIAPLILGVIAARSPTPGEESALRLLVDDYFAAWQREDLEAVKRLWDPASPEREARSLELQALFAAHDAITVGHVRLRSIEVDGGRADLRVEVEITATDIKSGGPATGFGPSVRALRCARAEGGWRVTHEAPAVEDLAAAMTALPGEEDRVRLLERESSLVTVGLRQALVSRGDTAEKRGEYALALELYAMAQSVAERIGDRAGVAVALGKSGSVHNNLSDYDVALELQGRALAIEEEVGRQVGIGAALNNIGLVHRNRGDYLQATEYFGKSLDIFLALEDRGRSSAVLNNLGNAELKQGNYAGALEHYGEALSVFRAAGNERNAATALNNIGIVHMSRGDYRLALEHYRQSAAAFESAGDRAGIARTHINMGVLHKHQGNAALALEQYQAGLALWEDIGNKSETARALSNIGDVWLSLDDAARALDHYQRSLLTSQSIGDREAIAGTMKQVGAVHRRQGNLAAALDDLGASLALHEDLGHQAGIAFTLAEIAEVQVRRGDPGAAVASAERAARIAATIGGRETSWVASTAAGRAHRALGRIAEARRSFEAAITTIEELQGEVAGAEEERQRFFEDKLAPYHEIVGLLIAMGDQGRAFEYAERARARVLLDVLRGGRVNITHAMTSEEKERESALERSLISFNAQISSEAARPKPDPDRLARLRGRLEESRLARESFRAALYAAHPDLEARRAEMPPARPEELVGLLPGREGAFLEYVVTDDRTWLFVATDEGGLDLEVISLGIGRIELARRTADFRGQLGRRDLGFQKAAADLYDLLLRPAYQRLAGRSHLVIVPDGPLWEMPFQALSSAPDRYLLDDHALSYAPSLAALREMRRAHPERRADPTLLALGNPDLDWGTTAKTGSDDRDGAPGSLMNSEREVRTLARLYGKGKSTVYTGTQAREDLFKREAGAYGVLHLSTHGILDDASPLYSRLLLSPPRGSSTRAGPGSEGLSPADDGLLEAWEIMRLDLKAELVVLSSCESARGKVAGGEGMIGLTWALFVAGVPATVVSQWEVDSASTTDLMLAFHRGLRSGHAEGEALRRASLRLLRDSRYRHPFYWAGFVVVGAGL